MITSLAFDREVSITVGDNERFKFGIFGLGLKSIPACRVQLYKNPLASRLKDAATRATVLEYLHEISTVFKYSVTIAEIAQTADEAADREIIAQIRSQMHGAIFYRVTMTSTDTADTIHAKLTKAATLDTDQIVLCDETDWLTYYDFSGIIDKIQGVRIAVCDSPISMGATCCLPADYLRQLQATYCTAPYISVGGTGRKAHAMVCACVNTTPVTGDIVPLRGARETVCAELEHASCGACASTTITAPEKWESAGTRAETIVDCDYTATADKPSKPTYRAKKSRITPPAQW